MEKRITVHNPTAIAIYVGSDMVPPGETRDFPESRVPPHLRPQDEPTPVAEVEPDLIADLRALSVKDIVSGFDALSDEDLARLDALENASETPRKSLLSAIVEAQLERAAKKEDGDAGDQATGGSAGESGSNG